MMTTATEEVIGCKKVQHKMWVALESLKLIGEREREPKCSIDQSTKSASLRPLPGNEHCHKKKNQS